MVVVLRRPDPTARKSRISADDNELLRPFNTVHFYSTPFFFVVSDGNRFDGVFALLFSEN